MDLNIFLNILWSWFSLKNEESYTEWGVKSRYLKITTKKKCKAEKIVPFLPFSSLLLFDCSRFSTRMSSWHILYVWWVKKWKKFSLKNVENAKVHWILILSHVSWTCVAHSTQFDSTFNRRSKTLSALKRRMMTLVNNLCCVGKKNFQPRFFHWILSKWWVFFFAEII